MKTYQLFNCIFFPHLAEEAECENGLAGTCWPAKVIPLWWQKVKFYLLSNISFMKSYTCNLLKKVMISKY